MIMKSSLHSAVLMFFLLAYLSVNLGEELSWVILSDQKVIRKMFTITSLILFVFLLQRSKTPRSWRTPRYIAMKQFKIPRFHIYLIKTIAKSMLMPKPFPFRNLLISCFILFSFISNAQDAVSTYGQLRVEGTQILNQSGQPVQLRGMSLFWSNWQPEYYNKNTVQWLRDDWCLNVIRTAMAVDIQNQGYRHNKVQELAKVETVIDAAIDLGIYVVVDFHSHHASDSIELVLAREFFGHISEKYGDYPNVIYEPFNEPLQVSWSDVVKPYHEAIIATIRANDPDNIIVLGSPWWDQNVDEAADDPVVGDNLAYALHYYAADHKLSLRNKAQYAIDKGLCLFVTEYGVCEANGDGFIDEYESNLWWDFLDENKISHCNWAVSDENEAASALQPDVSNEGNWVTEDLRPSGVLVRDMMKANCPEYGPAAIGVRVRIPALIEAEEFAKMFGIELDTTQDNGGGTVVSDIHKNDYVKYEVLSPVTGTYDVEYRVSSTSATGFDFYIDEVFQKSIAVGATGGLESWITIDDTAYFTEGEHTFKWVATGGDWQINSIRFIKFGIPDCMGTIDGTALVDDCGVCSGGETGIERNSTCEEDCSGKWGGNAQVDSCGVCAGGTTGIEAGVTCSRDCSIGLSATGAFDDFTLFNEPSNEVGVIKPFGEDLLEGDNNPAFQATFQRVSADTAVKVTMSQGQGEYKSFGFEFGNGNYLDLSEEATIDIDITNTSDYNVVINFAIESANGNWAFLDRDAVDDAFGEAWRHEFSKSLNAGRTGSYSLDFNGALNANYSTETFLNDVDFKRIVRFQIRITNQSKTSNWQPLALSNATFEITHLKIGRCAGADYIDCNGDVNGAAFTNKCEACVGGNTIDNEPCESVGLNEFLNHSSVSVYPNPVSDRLEIKADNGGVEWLIYDVQGQLLKEGVNERIDLSDFEKGLYYLNANNQLLKLIKL